MVARAHPAAHRRRRPARRHGRRRASTSSWSARPRRTTTTGPTSDLAETVCRAGQRGHRRALRPGPRPAARPRPGAAPAPRRWPCEALDHALGAGPAGRGDLLATRPAASCRTRRTNPSGPRAEETGAVLFLHPFGCTLDERLDRWYLSNTVGQPTENAVALSHLIFSGVLDRHPGPEGDRRARRRLPAHPHRPLRPRLADPTGRARAARPSRAATSSGCTSTRSSTTRTSCAS